MIGKRQDSCYHVATNEGIRCEFSPTTSGLCAMDIEKDADGCVFSRNISSNAEKMGNNMRCVSDGDRTGDDDAAGVINEENDDVAGVRFDVRVNDEDCAEVDLSLLTIHIMIQMSLTIRLMTSLQD